MPKTPKNDTAELDGHHPRLLAEQDAVAGGD